ncbi:MAG: DUF445 domain-containing protein [Gammaproteobacteria bacterium]|nr:DUF445 domain-containing protein [Gammaproteobacteria bacterium]
MNKSFFTNLIALTVAIFAHFAHHDLIFTMAVFALSGAITNWLAIHMLFEKVPGLYGSGVIPAHFEEFKQGIRNLIMNQFFTEENIDRFLNQSQRTGKHPQLATVIGKIDLSPAFDTLVKTIMESSFGSMLAMVGGEAALIPLKQPFIDNMRASIVEITESDEFSILLIEALEQPDVMSDLKQDIQNIIDSRLDELTPKMVKTIIQDMIRQHLGWLVVWGGIFGALIGLLSQLSGLI